MGRCLRLCWCSVPHQTSAHQSFGPLMTLAWIDNYCEGCHLYLLVDFSTENRCFLSFMYLFIPSFIYINMYPCFLFLFGGFCYYHFNFYFDAKIVLDLARLALQDGSLVFLTCPHSLNISLLAGTTGYSRPTLYFSFPSSGIIHFSKESWFLLVEVVFRDQNLDA